LSLLGDFYEQQGDYGRATPAYGRAFRIRRRLAAANPSDDAAQLDLAASQVRLALLAGQAGRSAEARENWDKAFSIYHAVASRHRFTPTLDVVQSGWALQVFLLAGILTLVGGFGLLARYRRAVSRWMKAAVSPSRGQPVSTAPSASAGADALTQLAIRSLAATAAKDSSLPRSMPIAGAKRALRGAALVQVIAGCAFAFVATVLTFFFSNLDYLPVRAALIFWSWAWAVVLVLALLWGGDRKKTGLVLGHLLRWLAADMRDCRGRRHAAARALRPHRAAVFPAVDLLGTVGRILAVSAVLPEPAGPLRRPGAARLHPRR
jgi:hypothetical protein